MSQAPKSSTQQAIGQRVKDQQLSFQINHPIPSLRISSFALDAFWPLFGPSDFSAGEMASLSQRCDGIPTAVCRKRGCLGSPSAIVRTLATTHSERACPTLEQ